MLGLLLAAPAVGAGDDPGVPAILVRGCAGLAFFGSHFCAGVGAGWAWPKLEVGALAGYSRLRMDYIVLGPGERYTLMNSFEGSGWIAFRGSSALPWRAAALFGLGGRRFTLDDFGDRYRKNTFVWSAAAGPGLGPAFVLLGLTGPRVPIRNSSGLRLDQDIAVHFSLNVVLDLWEFGRRLRSAAPPAVGL